MTKRNIGVTVHDPEAGFLLEMLRHAESVGIPNYWLTTGAGPDAMMVFAAAATVTRSIRMGTAIVPTFPRSPVVMAQQASDLAALAPGRFVLGLGPSHKSTMEQRYGIPYEKPIEHLREYVQVVRSLLTGGPVKFAGKRFQIDATLNRGAEVPVMVSALRSGSFELAGEITDGAISWQCPARYLRDVALPSMERGAQLAGRARPRLVGQTFIALTSDRTQLRAAVERGLPYYVRLTNYQEMFVAAGHPEAREGRWSDSMIDAAVVHGDEATCAAKLDRFIETSGCDELIVSMLAVGDDVRPAVRNTLDFIGRYCAA
jgi:F420-dependent oxidoreductase-like protein